MSAGLCPKSWAGSQKGKSPELTGTCRDPSCQPCAQPRTIPGTGGAAKPELSADPTGSLGRIPACSPAWHFSHFSLWWKEHLEHSLGLSLYSGTFCLKMTTSAFSFLLKNFWCPFSPSDRASPGPCCCSESLTSSVLDQGCFLSPPPHHHHEEGATDPLRWHRATPQQGSALPLWWRQGPSWPASCLCR